MRSGKLQISRLNHQKINNNKLIRKKIEIKRNLFSVMKYAKISYFEF